MSKTSQNWLPDIVIPSILSQLTKPIRSLRVMLVSVKNPQLTFKQRNVVYHIPCPDYPNAHVGQTGQKLSTHVKEHKGEVRRQDENFLLTLNCLTTGHVFDLKRNHQVYARFHRDMTYDSHLILATEPCVIMDGDEGMRRPQPVNILTQTRRTTPNPLPYLHCLDKHDLNPTYHIYTNQHLHSFNFTRNSLHHHLTTRRSYRLEKLRIQIPSSRRCHFWQYSALGNDRVEADKQIPQTTSLIFASKLKAASIICHFFDNINNNSSSRISSNKKVMHRDIGGLAGGLEDSK